MFLLLFLFLLSLRWFCRHWWLAAADGSACVSLRSRRRWPRLSSGRSSAGPLARLVARLEDLGAGRQATLAWRNGRKRRRCCSTACIHTKCLWCARAWRTRTCTRWHGAACALCTCCVSLTQLQNKTLAARVHVRKLGHRPLVPKLDPAGLNIELTLGRLCAGAARPEGRRLGATSSRARADEPKERAHRSAGAIWLARVRASRAAWHQNNDKPHGRRRPLWSGLGALSAGWRQSAQLNS